MWTEFFTTQINNIINNFTKSNLTIKISISFNFGYIFDTKKFYGSLCALSSSIFL